MTHEFPFGHLDSFLSVEDFNRLRKQCKAKVFNLSTRVESDDDIFQNLCVSALRASKASDRSLAELINNRVYWRTGEQAKKARETSRRSQSISDIVGHASPGVEGDDDWVSESEELFPYIDIEFDLIEDAGLLDAIHSQVPSHLVRVAQLRIYQGLTNTEIAEHLDCPTGTVQYHWESYLRAARRAAIALGLTTWTDTTHTHDLAA